MKNFDETFFKEDDALFDRQGNNVSVQIENYILNMLKDIAGSHFESCQERHIQDDSCGDCCNCGINLKRQEIIDTASKYGFKL